LARTFPRRLRFWQTKGQFVFKVATDATKLEIKKAVESLFSVKVERVTTLNVLGKSKRTARGLGKRNDWKKAVISLQPGQARDWSLITACHRGLH
jgi:large subunit ribosomal protein L23